LLHPEKTSVTGPIVKDSNFTKDFTTAFIDQGLLNIKKYIFPKHWPKFLRAIFSWIFDKLLYPAKVLRIMSQKELPPIAKVVNESMDVLMNNLARERLNCAKVDLKITPSFGRLDWANMDQAKQFIQIGENEMNKNLPLLKKKLNLKRF